MVGNPATSMLSLTPKGTPCSGPRWAAGSASSSLRLSGQLHVCSQTQQQEMQRPWETRLTPWEQLLRGQCHEWAASPVAHRNRLVMLVTL